MPVKTTVEQAQGEIADFSSASTVCTSNTLEMLNLLVHITLSHATAYLVESLQSCIFIHLFVLKQNLGTKRTANSDDYSSEESHKNTCPDK